MPADRLPVTAERESAAAAAAATAPARPVRYFGRFQLLKLLGKSERTMAWRVQDGGSDRELVLTMPRRQPADAGELARWQERLRRAAKLRHPNLAPLIDAGVQDGWPFAVYDPGDDAPLSERFSPKGMPAQEMAAWALLALEGMAFAHDAGHAHGDLQPYFLLLSAQGQPRLMGLAAALEPLDRDGRPILGAAMIDHPSLQDQRDAAQRDVLAFGLLMHWALAGQAALEQADLGRAIGLLPPTGREIVRLPWATAHPVPDPLRVICNRATDRQERQRYRNARTLARALEGWLQAAADAGGGPLALLLDRLHSVGLLPATQGAAKRVAHMALMERERTSDLAEIVLQDPALSLELLRVVNTSQVRGSQLSGSGPILTVRRAILMLGLEGVRRAALGLREWPGPLDTRQAAALEQMLDHVKRAGRVAQRLRPPGYDAEVCLLVTLLQNVGRLAVQYHFPDEMAQILRLMQPAKAARDGDADEPGMSEEAASYAVLGIDIEALGVAVARHWGLDNAVLTMIRRISLDAPVHSADSDDDVLRALGSCAVEAVDATAMPPHMMRSQLQRVAQRYGRALGLQLNDLQVALELRPAATTVHADQDGMAMRGGT